MDETVTQTAFAIGYADVSSLIAAFKAMIGTSPGRIREDGVVMERQLPDS